MEPFVALDRARAEVEHRLDAVGPAQWSLPTPCTDWTVHDVVRHLVVGNKMATLLVTGASRDDTLAQIRVWHHADAMLALADRRFGKAALLVLAEIVRVGAERR